jgi:cytochrome c556
MNKLLAAVAVLTLAACNSGAEDANQTLAEANASGNEIAVQAVNEIIQSDATPLEKQQALALMKERHEGYEKIGKAMRAAKQAIDAGNAAGVRAPAEQIAQIAPQAIGWFPAGTGPDIGKTDARSEIWSERADFDAGMKNFQNAALTFSQAAQGSDLERMKAAHGDLGKTCKSCHDRFKQPD